MIPYIPVIKPNGEKIELPLWRACDECGGRGQVDNCSLTDSEHKELAERGGNPCDECADIDRCTVHPDNPACSCCYNGQIPIYYTQKKFEELTGEKVADDAAVWVYMLYVDQEPDNTGSGYNEWELMEYRGAVVDPDVQIILLAFPNQPAPKTDYRLEEKK